MQIPVGKITAITGNNGDGKTTLLNCLCGLGHHSKGTLIYNGTTYKPRQRQKLIYLVMQDVNHQLFTESVLDEVLISQSEESEEEARKILGTLDLEQFAEPTSGLDYTHMLQIGKILRDLKTIGKNVIVVTHDRELIKECCDEEICLRKYNQI